VKTRYVLVLFLAAIVARADGPADNIVDKVRPVPPPGVAVPAEDRAELQNGVDQLNKEIAILRESLKDKPALALLPDVQIYHNAVRYALMYNEFFNAKEIAVAKTLLKQGMERAAQLKAGKPDWTTKTGLVVRGYLSKIDGSVQPYGLVVPESFNPDLAKRHRLDFWCHGRGENLSELNFIDQRQRSAGEFTPKDAFVVHLYGRYCCANKLAGEIDLLEVLDDVKKNYPIDDNRVVIRGFSMGGAACWQFAVHYPTLWAAAAPGAGFSETADFLKVFQKEAIQPTDYEKKLWHMYDCTDYALNLFNVPTVAYSGEIDSQKQAADMMAAALKKHGMELNHLIGPKTGHSYHPETKKELIRQIDAIVEKGRDPLPKKVKFQTWTLRYNNSFWVTVDGLDQHWSEGRVEAEITKDGVSGTTKGVTALTLSMPAATCPFAKVAKPVVVLDGTELVTAAVPSTGTWTAHVRKVDGKWKVVDSADDGKLAKRHGLQGPIDDAFLDSFLMVKPTLQSLNEKVGVWTQKEMAHAVDHWRKQYRGEARVKNDSDVSADDIASSNLILWGDPSSNKILAKIADRLPIRWTADGVMVGDKKYDASNHVPVLIYPNPLNPKKYVVLNSGFTFREYDYLNNARQVPKLPDWAVIDVSEPASSRWPGKVVAADFFDEHWKLMGK
jgi:hypothetical protein